MRLVITSPPRTPLRVAPRGEGSPSTSAAPPVTVLIDDLDIRVLHRDTGQVIRKLTLDPTSDYQPAASNAETHPKQALNA